MRQDFRYSVHMMPSNCLDFVCLHWKVKQLFLSWDRCWATVNVSRPIKLLKVQNFCKFKMTIKIKKSSRALRPEAMTWERGGDDGKLFPSSQSVNYSFRLIRLWSSPPLPGTPSPLPPPTSPISQSDILSELIPGNVYFEEQIVALLLTQCVSLLIGRGTLNSLLSTVQIRVCVMLPFLFWNVTCKSGIYVTHICT